MYIMYTCSSARVHVCDMFMNNTVKLNQCLSRPTQSTSNIQSRKA